MSHIIIGNGAPEDHKPYDVQAEIAKLPGEKQARLRAITEAGLRTMGYGPEKVSDVQRIWMEAHDKLHKIFRHAREVDELAQNKGLISSVRTQMLADEVTRCFVEEFYRYNRDELLLIFARGITDDVVQKLVGEKPKHA